MYSSPKIAHMGPKRLKVTQKLGQSQKAELKRTWKIKFVQLHKENQKQAFNLVTQTQK